MARKKKRNNEPCEADMTPMIDVVFQLIIFFIVTLKVDEAKNENIILEWGPHGPPIKGEAGGSSQLVVEVDRKGRISMHGAYVSHANFRNYMLNRRNARGDFPILIRADKNARHSSIKKVMDICTDSGIWRINFMAIKEKKT